MFETKLTSVSRMAKRTVALKADMLILQNVQYVGVKHMVFPYLNKRTSLRPIINIFEITVVDQYFISCAHFYERQPFGENCVKLELRRHISYFIAL